MLDSDDKKTIGSMSLDTVLLALQDVIFPKFEEVKEEIGELKSEVGELRSEVKELDYQMTGVKYRLGEVEKKVEILIDSSVQVKFLEKRVTKLEASIA